MMNDNDIENNDLEMFDLFEDDHEVYGQYDFSVSALELLGYKLGEKWATHQDEDDLLFRFQEFYEEWSDDNLTTERYEMLYSELDPSSIVSRFLDTLNQTLDERYMAEAMLENYYVFEKGIISGVMSAVENIIV